MPAPAVANAPDTVRPGIRIALWTVAAVGAGLYVYFAATKPLGHRFMDLEIYSKSVSAISHGRSIYEVTADNPNPVTYPPFGVGILMPLALLRDGAQQVLWTIGTLALAFVTCRAVARRLRWPVPASVRFPLLVACVAVSAPFSSNVRFGQISVVVLALTVFATFVTPDDRLAGLALGVAIAIKLTPAVFIVYLVLAGRRRAAGWTLATFVGLSTLTALILPSDSRTFWLHGLYGTSRFGNPWQHGNQSLLAMLHRAGLDDTPATLVWIVAIAVIAVIAYRGAAALLNAGHDVAAIVVVGCLALVASPISWTHHLTWLVIAAFVPVPGLSARGRWVWWAALVALMAIPVPLAHWGHGALALPHYLGDNLRGFVAIAIVLVMPAWVIRHTTGEDAPEPAASFGGRHPA